jgi:hypothetical protein
VKHDGYSESFSFGPLERRGIVGGLRASQAAIIVIACAAAVIVVRALPSGRGLVLGALLIAAACAIAFIPVHGRTLEQWSPVLLGWYLVRRRGDDRYRSAVPMLGARAALDGTAAEVCSSLPPSMAGCEILSVPVEGGLEVGVLSDAAFGTLTAVLAVRVKAFGLLAEADQERRLSRWGRVLAGLARNDGLVRRVSVLERTVPSDGDEMQRYLVEARDQALPLGDAALRSYEALLRTAGHVTQDHELFVALQVDQRRAAGGARGRVADARQAACAVLVRELLSFAGRFEPADVVVEGALNPRMLSRGARHEPADQHHGCGRVMQHRLRDPAQQPGVGMPATGADDDQTGVLRGVPKHRVRASADDSQLCGHSVRLRQGRGQIGEAARSAVVVVLPGPHHDEARPPPGGGVEAELQRTPGSARPVDADHHRAVRHGRVPGHQDGSGGACRHLHGERVTCQAGPGEQIPVPDDGHRRGAGRAQQNSDGGPFERPGPDRHTRRDVAGIGDRLPEQSFPQPRRLRPGNPVERVHELQLAPVQSGLTGARLDRPPGGGRVVDTDDDQASRFGIHGRSLRAGDPPRSLLPGGGSR